MNGGWPGGSSPQVPRLLLRDRLCNQSLSSEEIVHHLFCMFFSSSSSILPSFVDLLNCLYLNLPLLVRSAPCPTAGGRSERAAPGS